MELCAGFQRDHKPPKDEKELIVYCELLGPELAKLHKVGAGYVGAVRNLSQSTQEAINSTTNHKPQPNTCTQLGPHIIRKIALAYSSSLGCTWHNVPIDHMAAVGGPDRQGAIEQLRAINPLYCRHTSSERLGSRLGILPLYIKLWCCLIRPLAQWEDHPEFHALVSSETGHQALNQYADDYRKANQYWPSPALVFEALLGSPARAARAQQNQQ